MANPNTLTAVYRQSHFSPAFYFLSKERRKALETLYAVCRVLDDAVDLNQSEPEKFLEAWREVFMYERLNGVSALGHGMLAENFLEYAEQFHIPLTVMLELIDKGVAVDLKKNRFQTAMDLESYCYGVAGTVGVACLPIFGVPIDEGKNFAVRLGIAIQWTNVLRDVGVDAKMGRIYLPLDHLDQFGYTESELFALKNSSNFQQLAAYEYEVAKTHYQRATELLPEKWKQELLPARIMAGIYRRLLDKLKIKGFPVLQTKLGLNFLEKAVSVFKAVKE